MRIFVLLTIKIKLGDGVRYFTVIIDTIFGKCPSRAPTKNNLQNNSNNNKETGVNKSTLNSTVL